MFIKLKRADNVTRRLLGHKCMALNPDILPKLFCRTDVVELVVDDAI